MVNTFPFHFIKNFKLNDKHLLTVQNNEILEFAYNELKEKKYYKEVKFENEIINIKSDESRIFFSFFPANYLLKNGIIKIENNKTKRVLKFDFLLNELVLILGLTLGIIVCVVSKFYLFGLLTFAWMGIVPWLITIWWQISEISIIIEKLRIKKMKE